MKSSKQFLKTYEDIAKSFHSSGLLRGKTIFSKEYKTIIKIIDIVSATKLPYKRIVIFEENGKRNLEI